MNILMVGEIVFVGENLKKGLEQEGNYKILFDSNLRWKDCFKYKYGHRVFDIVHIHSPNFKKLAIVWNYLTDDTKLVCHWHGSDLRHPLKTFPVYRYLQRKADMNLYSTLDLRWWIKHSDKKILFNSPVDTDLFEPDPCVVKQNHTVFRGGFKSYKVHRIEHNDMPGYLNQFETVDIFNADGLDDGLLSVLALEAAAVGCKVKQIPWLTREWVIKYASIKSQIPELMMIYEGILKK